MTAAEHDPDTLAWRAELAIMAFEATFGQIKGAARFLELGEFALAVTAVERAIPFWASALEEMRVIRTASRSDQSFAEVAVEYRETRDAQRKPEGKKGGS